MENFGNQCMGLSNSRVFDVGELVQSRDRILDELTTTSSSGFPKLDGGKAHLQQNTEQNLP